MSQLIITDVAPGIAWVEVPDRDLRILCGCPADAIKHLMRRGFVRPIEINGVMSETGPTAILLSDVMLQNGAFCNLAEFPVLQMFYRQGMLLPGHPANTGAKPLLIGRRDQVEAQMQYIYRGNYGLISKEELMAAGVAPDMAHDMMRLKLRFAFGRIQHPAQLLDAAYLDDDQVEIAPGVTITRIAPNRFKFAYDGQTGIVDLNLGPYEQYECPYPLGNFQFKRDYFAVIHSGEGDGWDIRRPSMGAVLVFQGRIYLVDAGPNLVHALTALGIGINEVEGVFHTHGHDDHFAGLTTLMQADHRIKYFAVPMVRAAVSKKLAALLSIEEEEFDKYFDVHDLAMDEWTEIRGLDVRPIFSPHPVETTIFQFRALAEGGYRTYHHYADIVALRVLAGMVSDDPDKPGLSQAMYDKVARDYHAQAQVKKVDIGGGMIHGDAGDFRDDRSEKIVLAHTANPLTPEQKKIGSGASFGTVDVLIDSQRDFVSRAGYHTLRTYFPAVSAAQLEAMLNRPIRTFNPESILFKPGQFHDMVYLLLTGQVEMLHDDGDFRAVLSAGALLGEQNALHGLPATETCRAVSFVQALEIPSGLYTTFVQRYNLYGEISRLMEGREFLSRTGLLGSVVSTATLNAIAQQMHFETLHPGQCWDRRSQSVCLIRQGRVERRLGGVTIEILAAGDYFGEESSVFHAPTLTVLEAVELTQVVEIPAELLAQIPNVRWKMFESFQRRIRQETKLSQTESRLLAWNPDYSVNIQRIDSQHKRLFATANTLIQAVASGRGKDEVVDALSFLLSYTNYHFSEEEALLTRYGYVNANAHCGSHVHLVEQVKEFKNRLEGKDPPDADEILQFLHNWIVRHILAEDRLYAGFLNSKGVY